MVNTELEDEKAMALAIQSVASGRRQAGDVVKTGSRLSGGRKTIAAPMGNAVKRQARSARELALSKAVDGRALRATGRVAQWNIRINPELRKAVLAKIENDGLRIVDVVERLFENYLNEES